MRERAGGWYKAGRTPPGGGTGGTGMTMDTEELRTYFEELCRKRGVPSFFDRFEPDACRSGGLRLHLDILPVDPGRPTVVFMPGTNAYALLYGEFLTGLGDRGFNVVGFDPRGHGRSDGPRGSYTLPELVGDMGAAVAYARGRFGDPIVVCGSSQGGITAFYYAASGEPVHGAICHNLADLGDPESVRLTRYPNLSRGVSPLLVRLARLLPELRVPLTAYLDLAAEPVRGMGNAKVVLHGDPLCVRHIRLKGMASLATERLPRPVETITTPILILHGSRDTIFPEDYVRGIYDRLTCRKALQIYPDLPHYFIVDEANRILPDVAAWIEEVAGPR